MWLMIVLGGETPELFNMHQYMIGVCIDVDALMCKKWWLLPLLGESTIGR